MDAREELLYVNDRRETLLVVLTCGECVVERGGPILSAALALCTFRVQFLLRLGRDVGDVLAYHLMGASLFCLMFVPSPCPGD